MSNFLASSRDHSCEGLRPCSPVRGSRCNNSDRHRRAHHCRRGCVERACSWLGVGAPPKPEAHYCKTSLAEKHSVRDIAHSGQHTPSEAASALVALLIAARVPPPLGLSPKLLRQRLCHQDTSCHAGTSSDKWREASPNHIRTAWLERWNDVQTGPPPRIKFGIRPVGA